MRELLWPLIPARYADNKREWYSYWMGMILGFVAGVTSLCATIAIVSNI